VSATISPELLLDVGLRVSAELGRARMAVSAAVGLPNGAIVELDRSHDEPIDLYVNGRHFGTGRLLIVDGEWAVRIESVDGVEAVAAVADTSAVVLEHPAMAAAADPEPEIAPITAVDLSTEGQAADPGADE
jgi:flagellar motor switch protein FliN